jgi:eukaryotic-like serine/threonine-protein kinase
VPAAGGPVETLTTPDAAQKEKSHRFPQFLPGGKAVLFTIGGLNIASYDDARIAVLSLETRRYKVVVQGGTFGRYVSSGSWSPDGHHLVYTDSDSDTGVDLWVFSTTDRKKEPFLRTRFTETTPRFGPDGRWIAYASNESGRDEVFVRPFPGPGGKTQISTDTGTNPSWSPDGREIFYRRGTAVMVVSVTTAGGFSASAPRLLLDGPYLGGTNYGVMADGKRFVVVERQQPVIPQHVNVVLNWFGDLQKRITK